MDIIAKEDVKVRKSEVFSKIFSGEMFVHPTDTIYGLGCNAEKEKAVKNLRDIKQRPDTPFSVIAPSKEWIKKNCIVDKEAEKYIEELPGPVTLILKLKNPKAVAKNVAPGKESIGVRIPNHWIADMVKDMDTPIITTSVNLVGKLPMTSTEDIDPEIQKHLHFVIYEGEKKGRPSRIIHLEDEEVKVRER
ncbi:threonylcarbamoyl-AMP synthase [Candidatus Woesearchaeota archaeon]|nr:threonylcarbamoyl-AMP synthase [Candidatus Woesearchaeota archaeon]